MSHKMILAYIRPTSWDQVEERLLTNGVPGFSVVTVKGCGEAANYYRSDPAIDHLRIETVVPDEAVQPTVDLILEGASSELRGDGVIFVLPVERMIRIRDGAELPIADPATSPPNGTS